jgi:hypothetical protein
MTRRPILSLEQVPRDGMWPSPLPPVALTLLGEINERNSARDEQVLMVIYQTLRAGEHHSMRTFPERYRAVDGTIADVVDATFAAGRPVSVHEMGASNAITSLELFERLRHRAGLAFRATDFFDALHVVGLPRSRWRVVFDADGRPLQFVGRRLVLAADRDAPEDPPPDRSIRRKLMAAVAPRAAQIMREAAPGDLRVERIRLFHPRCLETERLDSRFVLGRDDIFDPAAGLYDVLRVMGVERKFSPDRVAQMLRAVGAHVADGGLLVLGFNRDYNDARVPTTIFQRHGRRFAAVRDIAGGYEYKPVLLNLRFEAAIPAA